MFELPLFPLNTVLFPGTPLDLYIFEPRYRLLIKRCLEDKRPFGVVLIHRGQEADGPLAEPYANGCTARIIKVNQVNDQGHLSLTALGDERFHILSLNQDQSYLTGQVECTPLESPLSLEVIRGAHTINRKVVEYLRLLSQASKEDLNLSELVMPDDPLAVLYLSAALLQIPAVEKQPLLAAETASDLLTQLERIYRREIVLLSRQVTRGDAGTDQTGWIN
jgi:Lon protease-like protein